MLRAVRMLGYAAPCRAGTHKQYLFSGLFASAVVRRNWRSIHDDTAPQSKNSCEVEKTYGKLKNIPYNCRFIRLQGVREFFLAGAKIFDRAKL